MAQPTPRRNLAVLLGSRIRRLRDEVDLTQERLAWDCDLAKSHLSEIEAGIKLPSVTALAKIADRLGVRLVDLFVLDPANAHEAAIEADRLARR